MSLKKRKPLAELPGGTETILVVDDDNTVRALIRETLKMKGYEVLDAQFNSGALMAPGRHRGADPLMVADVMMPGVNGREFGRRSNRCGRNKILYISGYPQEISWMKRFWRSGRRCESPSVLKRSSRKSANSGFIRSPTFQLQSENDEFVLNMLQSVHQ